jgi:hypothetical protein
VADVVAAEDRAQAAGADSGSTEAEITAYVGSGARDRKRPSAPTTTMRDTLRGSDGWIYLAQIEREIK